MYYLIDGYNLLFTLSYSFSKTSHKSFQSMREELTQVLQHLFQTAKLKGILIFDGAHFRDEVSGRSYKDPLEIVYTSKGESADSYILEWLSLPHKERPVTVVSNDRALLESAKFFGASTLTPQALLKKGQKKTKEKEKPNWIESEKHFQRLLKIFEERVDCEED